MRTHEWGIVCLLAPLVLATQPAFGAAILSGAGGSWVQNVVWKQSPFAIKPIAESLLGYADLRRELEAHDPAINLLQWAAESADPPAFGRLVIHENSARADHVLMFQGIVDTYILPPMANATSLSLGLDLAGSPLDVSDPDLAGFRGAEDVIGLVGRGTVSRPATANLTGPNGEEVTGVVVQHAQGPIEDGHEVMFQTDPPKRQYEAFLSSWLAGAPTVIDPAN